MIATDVATPFITPIKLDLGGLLLRGDPHLLYQAWAFIAPGSVPARTAADPAPGGLPAPCCSIAGMAFAYYVVFPWCSASSPVPPPPVTVATDIASYLDFVLTTVLRVRGGVRDPGGPYCSAGPG